MWGGHMSEYWGMGGWGMGLIWIVILVVIVVVVLSLARGALGGTGSGELRRPLDILKERYAKGEIGHEEFERMKRDLES